MFLRKAVACSIVGFMYSMNVVAYELPRWESGLAVGYLVSPEYRGAAQTKRYIIPFPYLAYRGDVFKIDEEGMHGTLFKLHKLKLDFRVAGNVPVSSDELSKRSNMPALDPVGEIGPSLEYRFWSNQYLEQSFWMRLPFRAVFSVGQPAVQYQGWSFAPYVEYVFKRNMPDILWNVGIAAGPLFASSDYHNYFYKVPLEHADVDRPAYEANAGYSGTRFTGTVTANSRHIWLGAFARYDDLTGTRFAESPLLETHKYFTFGVSVGWIMFRAQ